MPHPRVIVRRNPKTKMYVVISKKGKRPKIITSVASKSEAESIAERHK